MASISKRNTRSFTCPKSKPAIVTVPPMNYIAVRGKGDPNQEGGEYKAAVGVLYALAYTLKMSYKTGHAIDGFFEYVVPPLEGFWWSESGAVDFETNPPSSGSPPSACRISWGRRTSAGLWRRHLARKSWIVPAPFFYHLEEGLCVQMMHLGPYDSEPASLEAMDALPGKTGTSPIFPETRRHHEIYLSDPRKSPPEKWKTVLRHPSAKRKNTLPCLAGGCFVIRLPAIQFRVLQQISAQPQHQHGDGRVYHRHGQQPAATSQAGNHMAHTTQAAMPGMAISSSTRK